MYQRHLKFSEAVERALKYDYLNFHGRASASTFWCMLLFAVVTVLVAMFICGVVSFELSYIVGGVLGLLFLPAVISAAIRRLHDVDKSAWWLLLAFTGVGLLPLIYWLSRPSEMELNGYGDVPDLVF